MEHNDKSPRGLPTTTWLFLFCIFNLVVTLALFGVTMRRTYGGFGPGMMQGIRSNLYQGGARGTMMQRRGVNYNTQGSVTPNNVVVSGATTQPTSGANQ